MHNLALELQNLGWTVSGSDDEIYDPAHSRLSEKSLLPDEMGWFPERIHADLDIVILGMHAHVDNPELARARERKLKVVSFPEFVGSQTQDVSKIVVCGSHGKSTTTAMIMHVLHFHQKNFDYLLGGMLDGFDRMVRLSGAPLMVIEGDEYLSSRHDPTPKMLYYKGEIIIVTGIEWDHKNVFPTFDNYKAQFATLLEGCQDRDGTAIYFEEDDHLHEIITRVENLKTVAYNAFFQDENSVVSFNDSKYLLQIFGKHNMANANAARIACNLIGLTDKEFFDALTSFKGVGKRLEKIANEPIVYLDYAHAPSKVRATVEAVSAHHHDKTVIAVYELHTYSSLDKEFIPNYKKTMEAADEILIYFDAHALEMKRMPALDPEFVKASFRHSKCTVIDQPSDLEPAIQDLVAPGDVLLLMSSGNFGGLNVSNIARIV